MCGYFCIEFIDFMLAGKKSTDSTNLFTPYDFSKNDQIILSYFKDFILTTGIIKILLDIRRKKKKKHDQILMLAESKFNSTETLMSQALNDLNITHEEFMKILKKKNRYKRMKYNLISENEDKKQETIKLNTIK